MNAEPPPFFGSTEAELRECVASGLEAFFGDATQSVTVDGFTVPNPDSALRLHAAAGQHLRAAAGAGWRSPTAPP